MMPMAGEAYSIVNKSLETGGRGSTTISTDYSAISDAMMKKAQLHTQIAGMQMDFTSQKAGTLSNLELNKANIHMKGAELAQRESHFNREMKAREDADKMSPFEQITGVLAGAAAPAAAGFAIGGPVGAVVGGVAGGAMTMGAGNSRSRQQNIIGNLGTISNAAVAIKGVSNANKAKDATTEMIKGVGSVAGIFRTAAPGSEEFQGAERQLDNYFNQYAQAQIQYGNRPVGEVHKEIASLKKEAMNGYDPSDPQMVANRKIAARVAEARADEAFMRGDRKAVQQFQADTAAYHIEAYGKAPTNAMMKVWTGQADMGVAENYYRGISTMQPSGTPTMKNSTNTGATVSTGTGGATAQGTESPSTGTPTAAASNAGQVPQNGLLVPNAVVPGAGVGVIAPQPISGSDMWGVDMDNGPEKMMADASANFNEAAAKDPSLIDKALNKDPTEVDDTEYERKPGGGLLDRIMPMSAYEKQMAAKEGRGPKEKGGVIGSESKGATKFNAERQEKYRIEREEALSKMSPAERTYFTSTDPVEIQNAVTEGKQLDTSTDGKLKLAGEIFASPAQMNDLKARWEEYGNKYLSHLTPEQKTQMMKDFKMAKYGQGGKDGTLNMESQGGGLAGLGVQAHFQQFKTNFEMQMDKAGFTKEETDAAFSELMELDSMTTATQGSMAKAGLGGNISDTDMSMYMLQSVADPDDLRVRRVIEAHQKVQFKKARSLINNWGGPKPPKGSGGRSKANDEFQLL